MERFYTGSNEKVCGTKWNTLVGPIQSVAYKHYQYGRYATDVSDYAEAMLTGLERASRTYDPSKGTCFLTYAWSALHTAAKDVTRSVRSLKLDKPKSELKTETYSVSATDEPDSLLLKTIKKLLSERDYEWFYLHHVEGWTVLEIAKEFGYSKPTIQTSLNRSKALLRRELNV